MTYVFVKILGMLPVATIITLAIGNPLVSADSKWILYVLGAVLIVAYTFPIPKS